VLFIGAYGMGATSLEDFGLALATLLTRSFFLLPDRELPLPAWLRQGLRYAPLAALAAVVAPEIVLTQGHLIATWRDARIYAVAVGMAYFVWRRGILGTIVAGTAVMLALRIGLGW
jgi:branched-subunit amino acid transport protein